MISEKSQDHKSYDHLSYQIAIMQENHLQEMQDMHRQHQKEMQDMHERQLVIQKQTDLINMFNQIMHEIQRLTDQYVAGIREYSHLKDIDNSYFGSLSGEERARMYHLENLLGTDDVIDVRVAITIVKQRFERVERLFASQLAELEDALDQMDIDEMKQLQKNINKKHLSAQLQEETWQIKMEMGSTSRALQKPGVLSRITSRIFHSLIAVISKIMT